MSGKQTIYLFTDGASSGNPGPGGYGIILRCGTYEKEMSGGFQKTTNNRMELLAVIIGLEAIKWKNANVEVYSDSSYVVKALNEGWLDRWVRRSWKKVKNVDLWMRFLNVYKRHNVNFHWLKGHAGHPENERCDALAVAAGAGAAAAGVQLPEDEGYLAQAEEGNVLDFS
jgi:ribonuclease HI